VKQNKIVVEKSYEKLLDLVEESDGEEEPAQVKEEQGGQLRGTPVC
jgi:hypothetical protein